MKRSVKFRHTHAARWLNKRISFFLAALKHTELLRDDELPAQLSHSRDPYKFSEKRIFKNRIWIVMILLIGWNISYSQMNFSALVGGGISDLHTGLPFSDNSTTKEYLRPGSLMQVGASVSSRFRKEGMLSWEAQLLIRRSTLRSVPIDFDKVEYTDIPTSDGGVIRMYSSPYPRDYSNVYRWHYWSVNVPVSLNFQVFGPVGWKIGGNANFLLSEFPEEDKLKINGGVANLGTKFDSFNWQGHIGIFASLGPKIRLEALAFSDFKPRLTHGEYFLDGRPVQPEYRGMGMSLNVLYRLY